MGAKISIDKHVSTLEDILDMSYTYFEKIKFESKIAPSITQHLKVKQIIFFGILTYILDLEIQRREKEIR